MPLDAQRFFLETEKNIKEILAIICALKDKIFER